MVSTGGGVVIGVLILLTGAVVGWVVFTQMRARRLGLPPPDLASYLPWKRNENPHGPPQPAPGGIIGWLNDQVRKVKNRGSGSGRAAGAASYEQPLHGAAGRRGFGPLDPDEAWDARVGHEADGYGYLEEQELGGRHGQTEYMGGGGYNMNLNLAATPGAATHDDDDDDDDDDEERGRVGRGGNPFDDDAVSSLRGVSPRPMDGTAVQTGHEAARGGGDEPGSSPTDRRSAFRENV